MANFLIVEARFYSHLNDMLVAGAKAALEQAGHSVDVITVPGALEVPGAIALAAIAQDLVRVEAAAFVSPMWGLKSKFFGMSYLVWAMRATGRSGDYAIQPGPPEKFETNIVTHDKRRWELQRDLIDAAPDLELGPVTWGWLGASLDILATFTKPRALSKVTIPVFVASASEEKLVDNASHVEICRRLKDCDHITVEGAMHEILMETDDRRAEFWAGFQRLLKRAGI